MASRGTGSVAAAQQDRATQVAQKAVRAIRDPNPTFSAVAVDVERNEVFAADENLFQILTFDRLANTAPTAGKTEPRRVLGGDRSGIEYVAGLYVDPRTGNLHATHGDTTMMVVYSPTQQGNTPPIRQLEMPKVRGIAVDEVREEIFVTSQHDSAVLVFRKDAAGKDAPIRFLQGDRTRLANPHGIAVDTRGDRIFVANHGQVSSRSPQTGERRETPDAKWPLERGFAVLGSGRFLQPSITVYRRTASGDTAPARVIEGPKTQLNWPAGLVFDETRRELIVANDIDHSILVFRDTAEGNAAPLRVLKGPSTGLRYPAGLFLDTKHDELWVANYGNSSLTVYKRGAAGDTPPVRTIRGGPIGTESLMIGNPGALAYDTKREQVLVPN